ncbi:MAG: hypothetical protein U0172_09815 [Nitrospiraceae bacterium]
MAPVSTIKKSLVLALGSLFLTGTLAVAQETMPTVPPGAAPGIGNEPAQQSGAATSSKSKKQVKKKRHGKKAKKRARSHRP